MFGFLFYVLNWTQKLGQPHNNALKWDWLVKSPSAGMASKPRPFHGDPARGQLHLTRAS